MAHQSKSTTSNPPFPGSIPWAAGRCGVVGLVDLGEAHLGRPVEVPPDFHPRGERSPNELPHRPPGVKDINCSNNVCASCSRLSWSRASILPVCLCKCRRADQECLPQAIRRLGRHPARRVGTISGRLGCWVLVGSRQN